MPRPFVRLGAGILATAALCFFALADGVAVPGAPATIGSRGAAIFYAPSAAASYTGPLDLAGFSSNVVAFWSFRCSKSAYSGSVFTLTDSHTTHSDTATCSAGVLSSSPDSIATLKTDCNSGSGYACTLTTLYDQSGHTNCNGAASACDLATFGSPKVYSNCPSFTAATAFCGYGTTNDKYYTSVGTLTALAQPFSVVSLMYWTGGTSSNQVIQIGAGAGIWSGYASSTQFRYTEQAGENLIGGTASLNAWFSLGVADNGASTSYMQPNNASATMGALATLTYSAGNIVIGNGYNSTDTGYFEEGGIWSADQHANFASYYSNASAYFGGF
jgi:hypothetical protein